MKFLTLSIQNFLTIKNATIKLADRGLNLIQGVNDVDESASSNGAGKSSIADAICWCLYGVTAREVKGDDVVNRGAKKETFVIVTVQNGASTYKIERYRKHSVGKNSLRLYALPDPTGPSVDMTRGTDAETQKEVEKVLGASHEVFVAAVYSGQEAMPDLPRMGDRDLKKLIEEAAGLQRIERAYTISRERLNAAKNVVSGHRTRLETVKTSLARTETGLELRRQKQAEWDAGRSTVLNDLKSRVDTAKDRALAEATLAAGLRQRSDEAGVRLAAIAVELGKHAALQTTADNAAKVAAHANQAIERHALQQAKASVDRIQEQVNNPAAELSKPCTECGTPGSLEKMDDWVAHKQAHLDAEKQKLAAIAKRVTQQVANRAAAVQAQEEAAAAVPDVSALEDERTELNGVVSTYTSRVNSAQRAKTTYDQEKLSYDNAAAAVNPETQVVLDLEARLAEETAHMAALQVEIDTGDNNVAIADSVVKVFGPAGVRAQILDTVTPYLNARTADYLSILSDGHVSAIWTTLTRAASGDLKEKFSIEVTHAKGGDSFKALSGGEKRKVRLATALALQDLVASRATQPIELFFGDELDDALDAHGLERLMTLLERKARERGTVIIVSHSDIRDWCDQVTTVTKEGEWSSKVEGALCN